MHRIFDRTTATKGLFLAILIAGTVLLCVPGVTHAAGVNLGLTPQVEGALGLGTTDIRVTVARIISTFLGLLGIIAIVLILYGGFLWMTAAGNEEQVDKARKVLTQAVIGLAIILSSYAIAQFVLNRLLEATLGGGGGGGRGSGGVVSSIPLSAALGNCSIESHYPDRGVRDVPRNARIIVTFKEPMQIADFVRGYDDQETPDDLTDDYPSGGAPTALENNNVKIFAASAGEGTALGSADVHVAFTPDRKTFVFLPPLLGSPSADTTYQVKLSAAIRKADGNAAFVGICAGGYLWDFTVGTFLDLTPPVVESVIPFRDSTNSRNSVVEVTFNEAMDPTSLRGQLPGLTKTVRIEAGGVDVVGTVASGNRYRTMEFVTNDLCGTNSCGGNVYCLPGSAAIAATLLAATLSAAPPAADPTHYPSDGATDSSGNSLDGNGNGTAQGPVADNYVWNFRTTDEIDLEPPLVDAISPSFNESRVSFDAPVRIRFSKLMRLLTFTSTAMPLTMAPQPVPPEEPTCYSWYGEHVNNAGVAATSTEPTKSSAVLQHCLFLQETNYLPSISSSVQDIRQNCYYPAAMTSGACVPGALGSPYCCNGTPSPTACNPVTGGPGGR